MEMKDGFESYLHLLRCQPCFQNVDIEIDDPRTTTSHLANGWSVLDPNMFYDQKLIHSCITKLQTSCKNSNADFRLFFRKKQWWNNTDNLSKVWHIIFLIVGAALAYLPTLFS